MGFLAPDSVEMSTALEGVRFVDAQWRSGAEDGAELMNVRFIFRRVKVSLVPPRCQRGGR